MSSYIIFRYFYYFELILSIYEFIVHIIIYNDLVFILNLKNLKIVYNKYSVNSSYIIA